MAKDAGFTDTALTSDGSASDGGQTVDGDISNDASITDDGGARNDEGVASNSGIADDGGARTTVAPRTQALGVTESRDVLRTNSRWPWLPTRKDARPVLLAVSPHKNDCPLTISRDGSLISFGRGDDLKAEFNPLVTGISGTNCRSSLGNLPAD